MTTRTTVGGVVAQLGNSSDDADQLSSMIGCGKTRAIHQRGITLVMLSIHPPGETPQELSRRYARKGGAQCLGVTRRNLPWILSGWAGTSGDAPVLTNQLADVFTGSAQTCHRIGGKMSLQSSVDGL